MFGDIAKYTVRSLEIRRFPTIFASYKRGVRTAYTYFILTYFFIFLDLSKVFSYLIRQHSAAIYIFGSSPD